MSRVRCWQARSCAGRRSLIERPGEDVELRLARASLRQIHGPAERQRTRAFEAARLQFGDAGCGIVGRKGDALDALTVLQEGDGRLVVLVLFEDAKQLDVVLAEHDGVVAGAEMCRMEPARRYREAEPLPGRFRGIEVADGNDDVIKADDVFERHGHVLISQSRRLAHGTVRLLARMITNRTRQSTPLVLALGQGTIRLAC